MLVLSDVEGQYDALLSFLTNNGVVDDQGHWAFGTGPDPAPPLLECGFADVDDILLLGCETPPPCEEEG